MREAFIYYLTPGTAKLHTRHEKEKAVTMRDSLFCSIHASFRTQ